MMSPRHTEMMSPAVTNDPPGPQGARGLVQPRTASQISPVWALASAGEPSELYRAALSCRAAEVGRLSKGSRGQGDRKAPRADQ